MKKIVIAAGMLLSSLMSYAQFSTATDIDDLALIYIGSQHRPDWNKDLFAPYVYHTYPDGTKSWMFDGFLMIEFVAYNELGQQVSFGESAASVFGAKRKDWERLLHEQLGTYSGNGCRALDNLIDEMIPELGAPGHKHKVVFTLPVAETKSDIWGEIDGVKLDFTQSADRIKGMKWYADLLFSEWDKAGFKHLDLDGVYWTNETFSGRDEQMTIEINKYYKDKNCRIYRIPYLLRDNNSDILPSQSADAWQEMGVDVAYIQPGYYFQSNRPKKYLQQAIDYAWDHDGMGMEVEFEGYNFGWTYDPATQSGNRYRITPQNSVLYENSPVYHQRLIDYIDAFEENGVFGFMPVAYYSGFEAVYDLEHSGHPKDMELLNRLATILNKRHVESAWDKEPSAGIDDVKLADRVLAYGLDGAIYIADEGVTGVAVYSVDGKLVYAAGAMQRTADLEYGITVPCDPGIYVVCVGSRSVKVAVK